MTKTQKAVPEEYGGHGANPLEVALAQERLARGDGAVALAATMHLGYVGMQTQTRSWPSALFARICREVVAEGALINTAASEPVCRAVASWRERGAGAQ